LDSSIQLQAIAAVSFASTVHAFFLESLDPSVVSLFLATLLSAD
jgi:hypothetical protein